MIPLEQTSETLVPAQPLAAGQKLAMRDVVDAILALAELDGSVLSHMAGTGELRQKFPFRVTDEEQHLSRFDDIEEVPARRLTDDEYRRILRV